MSDKPLTQSEFARMGANATNSKYSPEKRREWAKKGGNALLAKYGVDYYKDLGKKSALARKNKKTQVILGS